MTETFFDLTEKACKAEVRDMKDRFGDLIPEWIIRKGSFVCIVANVAQADGPSSIPRYQLPPSNPRSPYY